MSAVWYFPSLRSFILQWAGVLCFEMHQLMKCNGAVTISSMLGILIKMVLNSVLHMADCRAQKPANIPCQEMVESLVDACPFNHMHTIRCYQKERFRRGAGSCNTRVTVVMPLCGHSIEVRCSERPKFLKDPRRCTSQCGATLECGHACKSTCGKCISETIRSTPGILKPLEEALEAFVTPLPEQVPRPAHLEAVKRGRERIERAKTHCDCTAQCERQHFCGHICDQKCHAGATMVLLHLLIFAVHLHCQLQIGFWLSCVSSEEVDGMEYYFMPDSEESTR